MIPDGFSPASLPPVAKLLPHSGNLVLLDELLACDSESVDVRLTVRAGTPYSREDGRLPASVGLELMGQAVAAWAGWQALQQGRPVELGFLLGTRHYVCSEPAFRPGQVLCVSGRLSLDGGNGMSVFECAIHDEAAASGTPLASARLNVFQPPRVTDYLQEPSP